MVNRTSNTTRIIDKLSEKNLVKRNICKENRRKIELFITNEGLNLLSVIDAIVEKTEDRATQKLKENRRKIELFITNEGLNLLSVIDAIVEKTEDKATQKLNEKEKVKLTALLKQIND